MRTLSSNEIVQVSGGQDQLVIDVNAKAGYVHINVMNGTTTVLKIFNLNWGPSTATTSA